MEYLTKTKMHNLTYKKKQIIIKICEGKTSKDMASELGIGKRTVELYRHELMKELHLESIAAVVIYAIKTGIYKI